MARLSQHLLKRLAAASISLSAGTASAETLFDDMPQEVLDDVMDEVADGKAGPDDRARFLRLLAEHPRLETRLFVVDGLGPLFDERPDDALALLERLARDRTLEVRLAAAETMADVVRRAKPAERIEIVCRWSLSEDAPLRAAAARVLAAPTPVFVTDLAITQLASDPHPEVRLLALRAAERHFDENPDEYRTLGAKHVADTDPAVRSVARALLEHRRNRRS